MVEIVVGTKCYWSQINIPGEFGLGQVKKFDSDKLGQFTPGVNWQRLFGVGFFHDICMADFLLHSQVLLVFFFSGSSKSDLRVGRGPIQSWLLL